MVCMPHAGPVFKPLGSIDPTLSQSCHAGGSCGLGNLSEREVHTPIAELLSCIEVEILDHAISDGSPPAALAALTAFPWLSNETTPWNHK